FVRREFDDRPRMPVSDRRAPHRRFAIIARAIPNARRTDGRREASSARVARRHEDRAGRSDRSERSKNGKRTQRGAEGYAHGRRRFLYSRTMARLVALAICAVLSMACSQNKYRYTGFVPASHAMAWDGRTVPDGKMRIEGSVIRTPISPKQNPTA